VKIADKYDAVYVMPYLSDELDNAILGRKIGFGDVTVSVAGTQKCMFTSFGAWHLFVVDDGLFGELLAAGVIKDRYDGSDALDKATVINYTKSMSASLNAKLKAILAGNVSGYRIAYDYYSDGLRIFGLVRFIGFFMSAVVILMTASMLYFRQIMAAEEEKHLYAMLRKIGMDGKMQRKVITRRLLPVFFIPLAVGIIHSVFAMKSADTMVFGNMITGGNSYLTVLGFSSVMYAAYAVVYAVFYLITKSQYIRVIKG
jgi:putative ABC transport system permease protein